MQYSGYFVITRLESMYGVKSDRAPGTQECWSVVTARACQSE
jgi:hypothetical protein